ncbi:hypothetical protein F5887DRAFT_1076169 [Amanita rubescens]|nr:hypothetical protein F5887DRAFT_1076169 [Amanita rubescens]
MSILYYWFIHRLDFMVYEQFLTPLKLLQLWTTWNAASTAEESSGASATAKNTVEVLPECVQAELSCPQQRLNATDLVFSS